MSAPVTAIRVSEEKRSAFLPHHAPHGMLRFENLIYTLMDIACPDYNGGLWTFWHLSNGGFFLSPDREDRLRLTWDDNFFDGEMSPEAAGIGVTLMALSQASFALHQEHYGKKFHLLREFALEHSEAGSIFGFID